MKPLINSGVVALNPEASTSKEQKTIIVIGDARSGTSMTASVLLSLGVFLGERRDQAVFEDVDISRLIEARNDEGLSALIEKRNATYDVWGWKRPSTLEHLERILPMLRNPHLVFMFRDPLAIAMRNNISMGADLLKGIENSLNTYGKILTKLKSVSCPVLLVSYEKALLKRLEFVEELCRFLDLPEERAKKSVENIELDRATYLVNSNIYKTTGSIWKKDGHMLINDLKYAAKPMAGVEVDLLLERDGSQEVIKRKLNAEKDFPLDLEPYLEDGKIHRLSATESNTNLVIPNSPILLCTKAKELRKPLLFFVHIPKTAGTSFRFMMNDLFQEEEIFPNKSEIKAHKNYPPLNHLKQLPLARLEQLKLVNGHYTASTYLTLPMHLQLLVFFRDPEKRVLSHIRHFQKQHPSRSLEEVFERDKARFTNTQIRIVADHLIQHHGLLKKPKDEFQRLLSPVIKNLAFIGITDRFDESINLLRTQFNLPLPDSIKKNKTTSQEAPSDTLMKAIEKSVEKELWLYEIVTEEFDRRIRAAHG